MVEPSSALLTDRVALVTGAAVGIGEAVAIALARWGADVAMCDRDAENLEATAKEVEAAGRAAPSAVFDVRDADAVRAFVASVGERFGRVDVEFADLTDDEWRKAFDDNFFGVVRICRAAIPHMQQRKWGRVVLVSAGSIHRQSIGPDVHPHYTTAKAAVANLTKTLALELGERGIRVNCVAPDVIPTPGIGWMEDVTAGTPLGRLGHVDDVAGVVAFLAGDLSSFVTGATIHVDGGNWAAGGWHRLSDGSFGT